MSDFDIGTLYVLANRDNSLAKIGLTRSGKPDTRADDYSRAHGIQWHVYWFAHTRNVAEAEARAHRELAAFRFAMLPGAREIFHITPAKAQRVAALCVVAPKTEAQLAFEQAEHERRQQEAEVAQATANMRQDVAEQVEAIRVARAEWQRKAYWVEYRRAFLPSFFSVFLGTALVSYGLWSATGDVSGNAVFTLFPIATLILANWQAKRRLQKRIDRTKRPWKASPEMQAEIARRDAAMRGATSRDLVKPS